MDEEQPGQAKWTFELAAAVRQAAGAAGFHLAGIAGTEPDQQARIDAARFAAWVDAGRAGDMEYLKRRDAHGRLLRESVRVAFPWARSIVVCAVDYSSGLPLSIDPAPPDRGWIGRYAWSGKRQGREQIDGSGGPGGHQPEPGAGRLIPSDYHEELLDRLMRVEMRLHELAECVTRCYVDTGPVVERALAQKAGVGWIGKNTCVINQELGSWLLLGVVVTSLATPLENPPGDALAAISATAADRCGSCTRCIDACPTDALVAPREMDASRCIAYLTIEKKGEIPEEFRAPMGRQVFGCDICQDVCPWNARARKGGNRFAAGSVATGTTFGGDQSIEGMEPRAELVNPRLGWLAAMDGKEFKKWFKGSPLERTGRRRLHRNVAIAMGNSGESEFLPTLRHWSQSEDVALAESARWAMERIEFRRLTACPDSDGQPAPAATG